MYIPRWTPSAPVRAAPGTVLLLVALAGACSDDGGDIQEPPGVAAVAIEGPATLGVGQSAQFSATARDASGETVEGRDFAWDTGDSAIATVSESGVVTAVAEGQVEIRASTEGVTGGMEVTVVASPPEGVAAVDLTAPDSTVRVGGTVQLTAVARDAGGNELPGGTFEWSSGDEAVATVSETGLVTGVAPGQVEIRAATEGVTGALALEVLPRQGALDLGLQEVASGLDAPLYLTSPPDDERLFIVEKSGRIRVVRAGALLTEPFLDLSGSVAGRAEQGLLGLAFPPDYASSGRFVAHYTDTAGDTKVSLFTVSSDADRASPGSERVLLTVRQPGPAHNGGQVAFGPDGYLYVGLGDGGSSNGDDGGRGQSLGDLLGAVLRIDVSTGTGYIAPSDNPFVGAPGARPEIWSYGLRNPWRFSFDRETGDLYLSDVGEKGWEEINFAAAAEGLGRGVNYGWSVMEGPDCVQTPDCDRSGLTLPTFAYDHDEGCSVIGGYVYRGPTIPELQGTYFYSDFCRGWVRSFRVQGGRVTEENEWPGLSPGGQVLSFGEDSAGELYVLAGDGRVLRIVAR